MRWYTVLVFTFWLTSLCLIGSSFIHLIRTDSDAFCLMAETSARGWCTEMTQKDGIGREVEGGFTVGNTCKSMADSYQCVAKTTTIL